MVRELTAHDLDGLLALQVPCFAGEAWTRPMLAEELSRPGGILLGIGLPVVAYVCAWLAGDELHLLHIATEPSVRRAGLATRLLDEVLHRARPHVEVGWLEVRGDNAAAVAFYEHRGWIRVGLRKRYYSDGVDAFVYRCSPATNA